jgi:aspartate racemase
MERPGAKDPQADPGAVGGGMKHIGILAHSAEGAALCFRTACQEGIRHLGAHNLPEITLTCSPMHESMSDWAAGNLNPIRERFVGEAEKLQAAGADFFVLPDNTAHLALEAEGRSFPIPALHIAEVVAKEASDQGYRTVGILGTEWTMEGPIYRQCLAGRGIESMVPTRHERAAIQRVIFDELCLGVLKEGSREEFVRIIEGLARQGCDAVALVCTEIPLLVAPEDSPIPMLDSTRLLASAAVAVALGQEPMPAWRGGPIRRSGAAEFGEGDLILEE